MGRSAAEVTPLELAGIVDTHSNQQNLVMNEGPVGGHVRISRSLDDFFYDQ
jgi:hypothetical protein